MIINKRRRIHKSANGCVTVNRCYWGDKVKTEMDDSNSVETFYYQLMHTMLKNTELLKNSKITLQHVSVYIETIFRELQSVLG